MPKNIKNAQKFGAESWHFLSKKNCHGCTCKAFTGQLNGGMTTANLYVPDGKGKFPEVITMHGHWVGGKLYKDFKAIGQTLAHNGYVCLVIDAWGAGERTTTDGKFDYHVANLGSSIMNIGESLMGGQLSDNIRGVDLLCSLPYVDITKIAATGASAV